MATSVSAFACLIPAGTPFNAPHSVSLNVNPTDPVVAVHWRVPPGPRGHVGWWLAQSGVQVLPNMFGTMIIADGQSDTWPLNDFPQSGAWSLVGFNTGTNDHTVYVEFEHEAQAPVVGGSGDILTGFPNTEADLATMWTGGSGLIVA